MRTVARSSVPSMASKMQGLRIEDPTEKALMVRVGTLIDAIVEAQRGLANPGGGSRRANISNLKKANKVTGSTENLFNAVSVNLDSSTSSANLSHQEVQVDLDPAFSDPTEKQVFANNTTFKGLIEGGTYNVRARLVTKNGQVSDWAILDPVITTKSTSAADLDGDSLGNTVESKEFTVSTNSQQFFCGSALGFPLVTETVTSTTAPNTTATQSKIKIRLGTSYTYSDVEEIILPGAARSTMVFSGDGESYSSMEVKRNNPIIFFTLITPTVVSYPAVRTLDVQRADGAAAYAASTKDTVWVLF